MEYEEAIKEGDINAIFNRLNHPILLLDLLVEYWI
jgi:hypothetical protein